MTSLVSYLNTLNCSINFVVYCMVGRSFRTTLLNLLRGNSQRSGATATAGGANSYSEKPKISDTSSNQNNKNRIFRMNTLSVNTLL